MVSADVALKASMYFWMMMFIGYAATDTLPPTTILFACLDRLRRVQFAFSRRARAPSSAA